MKCPYLLYNVVTVEVRAELWRMLISRIFDQDDIADLLAANIGEPFAVLGPGEIVQLFTRQALDAVGLSACYRLLPRASPSYRPKRAVEAPTRSSFHLIARFFTVQPGKLGTFKVF